MSPGCFSTLRRQPGQMHQLDLGFGLHPPRHLDAVLRTDEQPEPRVGKINEERVFPRQGHQRPGVSKFHEVGEWIGPFPRFKKPADDRLRRRYQMKIAVDGVKRPDAVICRRQQRDPAAGDFDGSSRKHSGRP